MAGRPSTTNGHDLIEWAVKHVGDRDPVRGYVLAIEQEARDDALRDAAERVARLPEPRESTLTYSVVRRTEVLSVLQPEAQPAGAPEPPE